MAYGRIFPKSMKNEVIEIIKNLIDLGINFHLHEFESGGLVIAIDNGLEKLPIDGETKEHYLPLGSNHGFSIYKI